VKKLSLYFNALAPVRQGQILITFMILFTLLLIWSLGHNQIDIRPGYTPKYIGHTNDSLTLKK